MLPETTSYANDCIFKCIRLMKTTSTFSEKFSHTVLFVIPSIHSFLIFLQLQKKRPLSAILFILNRVKYIKAK
jgi:hypothetical protein